MKKLSQAKIDRAIKYAWTLVGIPYKLGGNVPQDGGLDCSGFCLMILRYLRRWGITDASCQMLFEDYFKQMQEGGRSYYVLVLPTDDPYQAEAGDFLFFGKSLKVITHMAMGIGDGEMIEAGGTDATGSVRPNEIGWRKDLVAIVRFR